MSPSCSVPKNLPMLPADHGINAEVAQGMPRTDRQPRHPCNLAQHHHHQVPYSIMSVGMQAREMLLLLVCLVLSLLSAGDQFCIGIIHIGTSFMVVYSSCASLTVMGLSIHIQACQDGKKKTCRDSGDTEYVGPSIKVTRTLPIRQESMSNKYLYRLYPVTMPRSLFCFLYLSAQHDYYSYSYLR